MSLNFDQPVDNEVIEKIKQILPVVAHDRKTFLLGKFEAFESREMKKLANAAKQPARVELHGLGEIKTLEDGTRYEVTARGWRKLEP
jgi:hypothetical protein